MGRTLVLRGRGFPLLVAGLAVAACALISFRLWYLVPSAHHAWLTAYDGWATTDSAQYITWGGLRNLYSANNAFLALPGFLFLYAPVVALGDHLGLLTGFPFPVPRPSMWLLSGPFFFVCGSTLLPAVDYLAEVVGVSRYRRRWLSVLVAALVVIPVAELAGHPEDLLALTFSCLALGLLLEDRLVGAGVALAMAVMMQTWAGLLIPVFLAAAPPGQRMRMLLRSSVLPATVGVLLLALDFQDASLALLHQPMMGVGEHLPWWSFAGHVKVVVAGRPMSFVTGSSSRVLAVATAAIMAYRIRAHATPERIMTAAAVALYARGLFESEFWPYYLAPAAVLFAVLGAARTAGSTRRFVAVLMGAFLLYASAPMAYVGVQYPAGLALLILLATGAICIVGSFPEIVTDVRRRLPRPTYAG